MRSLRTRLILSHILPLLIVIPVIGIALIYLLEAEVFLKELSQELEAKAVLVASVAADYPHIWEDPVQAQSFTDRIRESLTAQVMLLDTRGVLLASTSPDDQESLGQQLAVPGFRQVLSNKTTIRVDYGEDPETGAAEVLTPVIVDGQVAGVIRLTDPLSNAYERFVQARTFVIAVSLFGLVVGAGIGWILAVDLARPLRRATRLITQMADGDSLMVLPAEGPEEIRQLLQAFNALSRELQRLENTRKRLLANLVHELARPLGALLSAVEALTGGEDENPDTRRELLEGIAAKVRQMRHLLDDLTQLYSQTLGAMELNRQPTPFHPWLVQVLGPWREAARSNGLDWQAFLPVDLPTLDVDAGRLSQALENVVSNAIKYTPPGGEVEVSAGAEAEEIWIRVRDSGSGIPPEELSHIFDPLYRGSMGHRFPQGMGLGLSIARDLITAHGGRIEVQSSPGTGSTFTIWLPR